MQNTNDYPIGKVIAASAAGTMIEWYDFYIFGSLATIIAGQFFAKDTPTIAFLKTLATFATGFAVQFFAKDTPTIAFLKTLATFATGFAERPFGAIFFGRIGDLVGRKYAFLVTLLIMGGATFVIGLLPGYKTIGVFAPIILVALRLLQGLALGGEYGGAAVYVAEGEALQE